MPTIAVEPGVFRARDLMMRAFPNEYTGSRAGALFKQGAVFINGQRVTDIGAEISIGAGSAGVAEVVFKVGRKYARVVPAS